MNESTAHQQCIARTTFQWILHQALVADEQSMYCGLIGVAPTERQKIQYVAMMKSATDMGEILSVWQEHDMLCAGYFHFAHQDVPQTILSQMPNEHIEFSVSLGEKGRLDLLAYHHVGLGAMPKELTLTLIEDGQPVRDT